MRARGWIGAGLALVVVIVAFVVAQGGGSGGGPLNAIAKAAEVTQREPGGHALVRATITSSATPEGITETGSIAFDDGGRTSGTVTAKGHKTGREVKVSVITDGTTSYASSDLLDSLPEGKKWMELDFSSAVPGGSSSIPSPTEGLKVLEHVQGAEQVGKEEFDGVPTTKYSGTLPTSKEVFGVKAHFSDPKLDVWIDGQDRVRRVQMDVTGSVSGEEGTINTEFEVDYVDFDRVPKIEPPPPDEVFNATSEFESQIQSEGGG